MPEEVRQQMYTEFLFRDFLKSYRKTFSSFANLENPNQHAYYTWHDFFYRKFMEALLSHLEPRHEEMDVILHNELDEVNEAIFFEKGMVDVGFEINRKANYVLRLNKDI